MNGRFLFRTPLDITDCDLCQQYTHPILNRTNPYSSWESGTRQDRHFSGSHFKWWTEYQTDTTSYTFYFAFSSDLSSNVKQCPFSRCNRRKQWTFLEENAAFCFLQCFLCEKILGIRSRDIRWINILIGWPFLSAQVTWPDLFMMWAAL